MATIEETITVSIPSTPVDIGAGSLVNAETYNGTIPGPTFNLEVGDTLIVRLINDLPYPTGIHWHGIELQNSADGTPVTQDGVRGAPLQTLGNGVPAGGTYLYKFKVPRPGIFWYHPHHHHSTNRVLRGLYGMIVVTDPASESTLVSSGVIPDLASTKQIVLSDTTVCKAPGSNDTATYVDPTTLPPADQAEWLSGQTSQPGPTPEDLCEVNPIDEDGNTGGPIFSAGEVPNIQLNTPGRTNEGQTVLTNGVNVGGRLGTPSSPGALVGTTVMENVQPGQGLRLQIVNSATIRYFRLILTTESGDQVPLVRIGGEGGLLDSAVVEGGVIGDFDTKYGSGEILLPPASRADVVAAIPDDATGVLTMWTRDYERTGLGFSRLPTVPVMHLNVTGPAVSPAYSISDGTPLLATIPGASPTPVPAPTDSVLDPSTFSPAKSGMANPDIELTAAGGAGINGISGSFSGFTPYTNAPHINSTRYAKDDDILELTVTNMSGAHHPFHLHGFSFQPISLAPRPGAPPAVTGTYNWPYTEFRDNVDVPAHNRLTFRVHIEDRELADGMTLGGSLGRWLFHCHIFFHAHQGMISELVITDSDGTGSEKPNIDVGGSWAYTPSGGIATRDGTYSHPDGDSITLSASMGTVTDLGGGNWEWMIDSGSPPLPNQTTYVYITATDTSGRKDQAVFRLKIGAPDDGSDNGDPHIHTVDGNRYDFQAVGEFILLRDREGMEVQTRQTPVLTANPITDSYTGLKSCVSLNTAVAARVGEHRISFQPSQQEGHLQFFVDGKPSKLNSRGIILDGHRVSGFDVNGVTALRVDYNHHPVLIATPHFWNSHNMWYLNVSVSHTQGVEGIMGQIPENTWLPALPSGATVGPMPRSLSERYTTLYETFANAWRVTKESSLFTYAQGTSTETFTDRDWPAGEPPCELKEQFKIPGAPALEGMEIDEAEQVCQAITEDGLYKDCVFDVATTGDEFFADGYRIAQELRQKATTVQVFSPEKGVVTAIVTPLISGRPTPKGKVTFLADGNKLSPPVELDAAGRATWEVEGLDKGTYDFDATYTPDDETDGNYSSNSPSQSIAVPQPNDKKKEGSNKGCLAQPWYIWIVLILIVLLLIFWLFNQ